MLYLSQLDLRWAADKLGASKLTLARWGCTTTCISMLSDYFGCYRTPKELAHDASNYNSDGLIIWGNLGFPKMRFTVREHGHHRTNILKAMKEKNSAVILQVNNGQHWVVGLRPALIGNDYIVLDPLGGKKVSAKKKYGNVTGAAYFSRR